MDWLELYRPLSKHSGELGGLPYLLQPQFPLWLSNTAFGFSPAAIEPLTAVFGEVGAPLAFTLPQGEAEGALRALGFVDVAGFELCVPQASPRGFWTEQVPWSEAWNLARILCEAHAVPQWRFPLSTPLGKFLQQPHTQAYMAYLYGDAVGAMLCVNGVGVLGGVLPHRLGHGVGTGLVARLHPKPFVRLTEQALEFPGSVLERYVRWERQS